MKLLRFLFLICILQSLNAIAQDESENIKCQNIGEKVVKITAGAQKISNIDTLVTWRASCAGKPPVGAGNVAALCDGDLVGKNGVARRIFYWQMIKANGEENIGYHLCQNTSSQTSNPVNLVLGNNFCEKVKNSSQLMELAKRVKMQVDQDGDNSQYSIDTSDKLIEKMITERHYYIRENTPVSPGFPRREIDLKLLDSFNQTINECMLSIYDSDLIYLFSRSQSHVDEIKKKIKLTLEESRPITNRKIDAAGNIILETKIINKKINIHRSADYSRPEYRQGANDLHIAWLIALDTQNIILKNLYTELLSTKFILPGTSNAANKAAVSGSTFTGAPALGTYKLTPNLGGGR